MRAGARILARLVVVASAVAGAAAPVWHGLPTARADDYRNLMAGDFYGYQRNASSFATNDDLAVVTGARYARAIVVYNCGYNATGVSFNARRFPGYKGISFTVGISDRSDVDVRADFTVTADGTAVYKDALRQGAVPRRVTLMFGQADVFSFSAVTKTRDKCSNVILGNPIIVHSQPIAGSAPPATSPRSLVAPDFSGYQRAMSYFETNNDAARIAGSRFGRAVVIHNCGYNATGVSLNAHRLLGYRSVRFDVGITDATDVDVHADFSVTADGVQVYKTSLQQGQLAAHVTIPFGRAEVFGFGAVTTTQYKCADVIIGNPVALP
jgi:hypothetical protein